MKTKFLLTTLLTFVFYLGTAQVPQGFNYQAIARDGTTGNPIINTSLQVKITIQSDSLGANVIWKELHSGVTTNGFGLFTIVVGKGTRNDSSTVANFNDIDWTVTSKYIMTEINNSGWKKMGSSGLWSVPYLVVSGDLGSSLDKLKVKGQTTSPDSALFKVKNWNGQTVFAVYNEGVRVYVDDGEKGVTGGFAIGGLGQEKKVTHRTIWS